MTRNKIIPYNPKLREYAKKLRNHSTKAEILLWNQIKRKALGYEFHRQVPLDEFIVDFFCHELMLAIEVDGFSHEFKYTADAMRQSILESRGVHFIHFADEDVKKNMRGVLILLKIKSMK